MKQPKPSGSRPAMLLLAGCFMVSALLRALNPAVAMAVEDGNSDPDAGADPAAVELQEESYAGMSDLLRTLREREAQLAAREARIAEKEKVIEVKMEVAIEKEKYINHLKQVA